MKTRPKTARPSRAFLTLRQCRPVVLALTLIALGACAGVPQTSPTYQSPESRSFAQDAMARGPMLVTVQGNPYPVPPAQLEQTVLAAMQRAMSWTATPRLTTDTAAAPTSSLFVVMTFDGGVVDANRQCAGTTTAANATAAAGQGSGQSGEPATAAPEPRPNAGTGGPVQVAASFCGSGSLISNTSGRIDQSTGLDDPRFGQMIAQVTDDLFPSSFRQMPGVGVQIGGGSGGYFGSGGGVGIGTGIGVGAGIGRMGW